MKGEVRNAKCEVLVCFAVKEEARAFQKMAGERNGISTLVTGIGRRNAAESVREFLANHSPDFVLTCGFAGGLNPELRAGTIVFSTEDKSLCERLLAANARPAKLFCAPRIAITVAEKRELRAGTCADVVEMESEVIQSVCREKGIPCATVRVISDTATEDLPLDFNTLSKPDMNLCYGKLAWAIVKSPGKIGALMRLQKRCAFVAEELAKVLAKVISR